MRAVYKHVLYSSERWDGFVFRDDDIVISTPPKCGTTWLQMLCALLVFQSPDLPQPLTELSPWLDIETESLESVVAKLDAQTHRRFIKSHTPFDGIPYHERVTYICVGRDPRDAALSWDNHFANMNLRVIVDARVQAVGPEGIAEFLAGDRPERSDDPQERFWQWVDGGLGIDGSVTGLDGLIHHLATFWAKRDLPNVALFHYSDLQANLDGEMRRLAGVLGIEVDEDRWPTLVEAATFDHMRSRAAELAPQNTIPGFWNDTNRFFNQGRSEQWRSMLTEADIARYDARVRELASPELAQWAHHGRLVATPEASRV